MRWLVIVLALAVAAPAFAQPRGDTSDRREKVKQKIRALRAYALTDALELDEKTAGRLFPILAKWDDVTDKLVAQRVDLTRQLGAADGKDAKAIDKLIDDAVANQKALWDIEDKRLAELRKILTPAQTAKLLVVLPRFERRIQNQLRRALDDRRPRGRFRGGRDFDPDDDDDADDADPPRPRDRLPAPAPQGTPRLPEACDPFTNPKGCGSRTRR